jgi:hypothetical protein
MCNFLLFTRFTQLTKSFKVDEVNLQKTLDILDNMKEGKGTGTSPILSTDESLMYPRYITSSIPIPLTRPPNLSQTSQTSSTFDTVSAVASEDSRMRAGSLTTQSSWTVPTYRADTASIASSRARTESGIWEGDIAEEDGDSRRGTVLDDVVDALESVEVA